MKIKTVWDSGKSAFDNKVNDLLANGWQLTRREVLVDRHDMSGSVFYAELVQLDPLPEPEQGGPVEALRNIRDYCEAMPTEKCLTPDCPLSPWCHVFTEDGISPADWRIPGEEAEL